MKLSSSFTVLSTLLLATTSVTSAAVRHTKRQSTMSGWEAPEDYLTIIPGSSLGEPLNVIISNASSSAVLSDPAPYFSSLFYSPNSCLGITLGDEQAANLNDGQGTVNQTSLYRYNFNNGITTCQQSLNGGMHFRYWVQQTTGAIFLAVSLEESAADNHMISPNGYDRGRDWFVGNATNSSGTTSPQDRSQYTSTVSTFDASDDVSLSSVNHGIRTDRDIYVLTVTQTQNGDGTNVTDSDAADASTSSGSSSSSSSAARRSHGDAPWNIIAGSIAGTLLVGSLVGSLSLLTTMA